MFLSVFLPTLTKKLLAIAPKERCHAAGERHNVKQAFSEVEKETSETLFIQKKRSVFWPGTFLEDCLSQHRVDCVSEDCLSHRYVKLYL